MTTKGTPFKWVGTPAPESIYYVKDKKKTFGVKYRSALRDFRLFIDGEDTQDIHRNQLSAGWEKKGVVKKVPIQQKDGSWKTEKRKVKKVVFKLPESELLELFKDYIQKHTPAQLALKLEWSELANVNILKPLQPSG